MLLLTFVILIRLFFFTLPGCPVTINLKIMVTFKIGIYFSHSWVCGKPGQFRLCD